MDISQVEFPLVIPQNADFDDGFQVMYLDQTPVNLTGWTAKAQFRKTHKDTEVILELSTAAGTITITGATGTIRMASPASVNKTLEAPLKGVWDLLLFAPSPATTTNRLLQGEFFISPGTTVVP